MMLTRPCFDLSTSKVNHLLLEWTNMNNKSWSRFLSYFEQTLHRRYQIFDMPAVHAPNATVCPPYGVVDSGSCVLHRCPLASRAVTQMCTNYECVRVYVCVCPHDAHSYHKRRPLLGQPACICVGVCSGNHIGQLQGLPHIDALWAQQYLIYLWLSGGCCCCVLLAWPPWYI